MTTPPQPTSCILELDALRLVVDPALGGAIRRLDLRSPDGSRVPLLRPTPESATRRGDTCCFHLLPWVGRIPDGTFPFNGRVHRLRKDSNDGMHAIHGDITQRAWTITDRSPISVRMELDARAPRLPDRNWPWDYRADLRYELGENQMTCELGVTNESAEPFPVGLGFHPYFQRRLWAEGPTESCVVHADVRGHYPLTNLAATGPAVADAFCDTLASGTPLLQPTDDVFLKGEGHPTVTWPRSRVRVRVESDESMAHLVLWAPYEQGKPTSFLCVEPLSTTTDAFNLFAKGQALTGVRIAEPGQRIASRMTLRIESMMP